MDTFKVGDWVKAKPGQEAGLVPCWNVKPGLTYRVVEVGPTGSLALRMPDRDEDGFDPARFEKDESMAASDAIAYHSTTRQVGGDHYLKMAIQPWDFIKKNDLGFFEGTAIAYIARWREKGGLEDLKKAIHTLEYLIEMETGQ